MGPPAVSLVLVLVLGLTATLPGLTMVHAVPVEDTTATNITREDNQCSPLQRRQDLLDNRMNERDSDLNRQLNGLDTRLNTRQTEVNTRFNRMDSRLDGIETAISDMKGYLQAQMEAMGKKVEWALTDIKPRREVSTPQPDTTPQQNVTEKLQHLCAAVSDGDRRNCGNPGITEHACVTERSCCYDESVIPHCYFGAYRGCQDALAHGWNTSGIYTIAPDQGSAFHVYCEQTLDGGGWTVFQARKDGSVDFYRDWITYKAGFGQLTTEFWLGNDKIHRLTKHYNHRLKIELVSPEGEVKYANYAHFWIEDEAHKYKLTVTGYSGGSPPGDSFRYHNGQSFSTKDRDNDQHSGSCANKYMGGWWYGAGCHHANLNGLYGSTEHAKGMNWYYWKGYKVSMRATRMMVRKRPC